MLLDPCCIVGSVLDVGSCWNYAGSVWNGMSVVESRSGNLVLLFVVICSFCIVVDHLNLERELFVWKF